MGSPATLPAMSQRATSMAPMARYVVWRFLCHIARYRRSRSSGSWLSTTGFRYWMSDCPSMCAPRMEEPRKACPLTPSSVSTVTRPSWLLPLNFPVCRPYVVAGISSQPNSVRWTSVIFMVQGDYHRCCYADPLTRLSPRLTSLHFSSNCGPLPRGGGEGSEDQGEGMFVNPSPIWGEGRVRGEVHLTRLRAWSEVEFVLVTLPSRRRGWTRCGSPR